MQVCSGLARVVCRKIYAKLMILKGIDEVALNKTPLAEDETGKLIRVCL